MAKVDYYVSQCIASFLYPGVISSCCLVLLILQHHGFSKISFNSTTLEFQFIRHQKNEVFDRFVLRKGAAGEGSGSPNEEEVSEEIVSPAAGL